MGTPTASSIKGSVVHEFLLWVERRPGGGETLARIGRSLAPSHRALVDVDAPALGILAAQWYPSELVHQVLEGVAHGLERGAQRALARDACRVVVPKLVRGIYKVVFDGVATPSLYARFIPRLWRQLHSTGERRMVVTGNLAESVVTEWPGHHPLLCDVVVETMGEIFHLMQRTPVTVERVECVAEGSRECRTIMRW